MRTFGSSYDPDAVENAEAAGIKVEQGPQGPSIAGYPLTASFSEDMMTWYLAEVKSDRAFNPFLLIMSLGMRKSLQLPSDAQLQKRYARLKKAGVSKEAICTTAISSPGHKIFNAFMIFIGMVAATIIVAPILMGITGNIIIALFGKTQTGPAALISFLFFCLPGPIIGCLLGYMFVKDSNGKQAKRIREKIEELDRIS